ncbi:MAG: hypothetical protein COA97_11430 [Flavobacteriales bacterium]|nr:MAG: hypothetical protein COA97_11430 [Flavobacteriales bacterium]
MSKYGLNSTPKEVMKLLAVNLRGVRKENHLTQRALSDKSGVAYATIKKFETTGIIALESLLKLCNALGRLSEFESILQPNNMVRKQHLFDI